MSVGTTPTTLLDAAMKRGVAAALVQTNGTIGVNVWRNVSDRYPVTTVWWGTVDDTDLIVWGDNYEHQLPDTTPADDVMAKIIETSCQPDE